MAAAYTNWENIVCIWVYRIWLCAGHNISGDGTPLATYVSSHVSNLSRSC